jgi:hypothetical protein
VRVGHDRRKSPARFSTKCQTKPFGGVGSVLSFEHSRRVLIEISRVDAVVDPVRNGRLV